MCLARLCRTRPRNTAPLNRSSSHNILHSSDALEVNVEEIRIRKAPWLNCCTALELTALPPSLSHTRLEPNRNGKARWVARHGERDCECQGYWSCGPSFTCPFLRKARRHGRLATRQSTNSRSPRFINTTVSSPKTVDVNGTTTPLRQKIRCSGNPSLETSVTMSRDSGPRTAALGPTPCSCSYR